MNEIKIIGCVEMDTQECVDRIIINDENSVGNLSELSKYSHVVIITRGFGGLDGNDIVLKQIFGNNSNIIGLTTTKLISVDGNVVTVEKFNCRGQLPYLRASEQILGIEPYHPEYDLQDDEEQPEWINYTLKKYA